MNDIAQINFREPNQVDWNNYNTGGSGYQAPPDVQLNGSNIILYGVVKGYEKRANQFAIDEEGNPYLNFLFDPIELVDAGKASGLEIRFTEASVKPFEKNGKPIKGNPNKLANFLRACGTQAKPQLNSEYEGAVKQVVDRKVKFPFVGDWEARNSDTGEKIKGYINFPDDPERPGQKKAILKKGDTYVLHNTKGEPIETRQVQSEILFANLKLKWFVDPTRGR